MMEHGKTDVKRAKFWVGQICLKYKKQLDLQNLGKQTICLLFNRNHPGHNLLNHVLDLALLETLE